jgi:hypothetical protein
MHAPLKILLDNINEAYYILGCTCALPQKVAYGAGYTTPAKRREEHIWQRKRQRKRRDKD